MKLQEKIDAINNKDFIVPKKKKKWYTIVLQIFLVIIILIGLAYSVFSIIYKEIEVVGPSMKPSLNISWDNNSASENGDKDKVCVNRFKSGSRFDIIVFTDNQNKQIIKRIIGIAGDTIKIIGNQNIQKDEIYINDKLIDESAYISNYSGIQLSPQYEIALTTVLKDYKTGISEITIPEGKIFVLGDNRIYSKDSVDVGLIDVKNIVGRVDIIIPHNTSIIQYFFKIIANFFGKD